ncbi:MAG: Lon family ATP-dependent protease [Nitrospiraceae bacterium]|nr:Lon family ATP-dependent protease [Nitrospiraceae bacterium]
MSPDSSSSRKSLFPIPDIVPIFPLPNVVLFPYTYMPLHVFESRYREMVYDAASRGQCVGMALLKEGWEDHYDDSPQIFEQGTIGRMVSVKKLSDGRYNIVLQGFNRCLYEEQEVSTSYRQAKISLLPEDGSKTLDSALLSHLAHTAKEYLLSQRTGDQYQLIEAGKISDPVLVNSLSAGLDFSPDEKQFLLESKTLAQQAGRLVDLLRFKLPVPHSPTQG